MSEKLIISVLCHNPTIAIMVSRIARNIQSESETHNHFNPQKYDFLEINQSDLIVIQINQSNNEIIDIINKIEDKSKVILVSKEHILNPTFDSVECVFGNMKKLFKMIQMKLGG